VGRKVISELAARMAQNEPYFFIFRLAERENEGYFIMFEGDHKVGHFGQKH
jgi:hypothetical protein